MQTKTRVDFISLLLYLCIGILGVASVYSATSEQGAFSLLEGRSGKQLMWFGVSVLIGFVIFILNANFFEVFSWHFYALFMFFFACLPSKLECYLELKYIYFYI